MNSMHVPGRTHSSCSIGRLVECRSWTVSPMVWFILSHWPLPCEGRWTAHSNVTCWQKSSKL